LILSARERWPGVDEQSWRLGEESVVTESRGRASIDPAASASPIESPPSPPATNPLTSRRRQRTRLSNLHSGLIVAAVVLVVLLVFILQNAHSVSVRFLGAQARLPLSVALLLAAVGGALLVGTIGAARITQLRRTVTKQGRRADPGAEET